MLCYKEKSRVQLVMPNFLMENEAEITNFELQNILIIHVYVL